MKEILEPKPLLGVFEWFAYGQTEKVEQAVADLQELGVTELRTMFSWAEWQMAGGRDWFDWFVPKLSAGGKIRLLPVLFYTPVELARPDGRGQLKTSNPPKNLESFAEFTAEMISRYGQYFEWIQLWNEPNWKVYWEDELDPDFTLLAQMLKPAARVCQAAGKKPVLGGLTPYEPAFITLMHKYGVLELMDAVSIHYAPSWPARRRWFDWPVELENLRAVLDGHGYPNCQIWITETGISTVAASLAEKVVKEKEQQEYLVSLQTLPAARIYWAPLYDQQLAHPTDDALNLGVDPNPTAYHFGLKTVDGKPKPVFNTWRELNRAKHKVKWKLPTD